MVGKSKLALTVICIFAVSLSPCQTASFSLSSQGRVPPNIAPNRTEATLLYLGPDGKEISLDQRSLEDRKFLHILENFDIEP